MSHTYLQERLGLGFEVWGLGFEVQGSGSRGYWGFWLLVSSLGFMV